MKKILLSIFISIFLATSVFARTFNPSYQTVTSFQSIGVFFAPKNIVIYDKPDENSSVKQVIRWDEEGAKTLYWNKEEADIFLLFKPDEKNAIMLVTDDYEGWCEVIYNKEKQLKGWVKAIEGKNFYAWLDFFKLYGYKNGLRFLYGTPDGDKTLYTAPEEGSQTVKTENNIESIQLKITRGNWALVKFLNYDHSTNIGWIRWRGEEGKVLVFPVIK